MASTALANVGVTGLAVMGRNLARNLARHGHVVAVHNRSVERSTTLVDRARRREGLPARHVGR